MTQRQFAASAREAIAPALEVGNVEQSGELRIGARAAAVKFSGERAVNGIRPAENLLHVVGVGGGDAGFESESGIGLEGPIAKRKREIQLRRRSATSRDAMRQLEAGRTIAHGAGEFVPLDRTVTRLLCANRTREGGRADRTLDRAVPIDFAADNFGFY